LSAPDADIPDKLDMLITVEIMNTPRS